VRGAGARDRDDRVLRRRPARAPACGGNDGPGADLSLSQGRSTAPAAAGERSERKPGRTRRAAAPPLSTSGTISGHAENIRRHSSRRRADRRVPVL